MAKSKFNIGDLIVDSLKLGDGDIKSFLGDSLLYPLAKSIEDAVVTCASATYNGSNQTAQEITVVLSGVTLVENTDYTVTQNTGGTNVGSYNVTVTGIGDYENTASGTFTINKVTPTVVSPVPNVLTYNGSAQELVTAGSTNFGTLKYKVGSDSWSTSIPTRTRGGAYTVYYKVDGDSNINDIPEDTVACSINEKPVTAVVTVSPSTYTYNGSHCEPTVTAKDGETVIDPSEYTATYSNNLNAGTATVTIYDVVGGDYYVEGSTTFTINKADQAAPTASVTAATYPGTSTASATGGGGIGTLTWTNGNTRTAAGTADTYAYWSGNDNYNASPNSNKVTLSVAKYTPTVTLAATNRQYNGNALYATASVGTPSGGVATKGTIYYGTSEGATTYNVTYTGGSVNLSSVSVTNVGSATVYAYFVPDSTCNDVYNNSSNVSKTFSVSKADQSAPTATGATSTYPTGATATASGGGGIGSIEWESAQSQSSVGSHTTRARWSGNSNYNASPWSNSVTVQMNKAAGSVTINAVTTTYNGSAQALATVSNNTGTMHYSTNGTSWSTSIPTGTNATGYTVYWYMDASTNYEGIASASSRYVSSTIGKANQSAPTATGATTTYNTTATATASGGGGQGSIEWSNGNTQTSVGSKTTKARWSGNSNYNASPYSNEVTVQMNKAAGSVTTAPVNTNYTYNGTARAVASAGSGTGTMYYRLGTSGSFSTTMPTMTNAGYDTLYYYAAESTNFIQSSTGSITVSVQKASRTISFTSAPTTVALGATITVAASPSAGSGDGTITYSSSNNSIATVNGNIITGVAEGTVTITVTISQGANYSSASTSYTLTVKTIPPYFCFKITTGGNIKWSGSTNANTLSYSKDNGSTWTTANSSTTISVSAGDKVLWKGTPTPQSSKGVGKFSGDTDVRYSVEGNAMSLLFGDNFKEQTSLSGKNYALYNLFSGNTNVTSADNMSLPATTLATYCYDHMFFNCTSLTKAPVLSATTLETYCYRYMFYGCTSLTTAPELPATTLANNCYDHMFSNCTSLTTAPVLSATTLATQCYGSMFSKCTSLTTAPVLSATTLETSCYQYMFNGCTSLTTAPELPATTLATYCYDHMFYNCTSLTTAPVLSAKVLAQNCYSNMFQGCTRLNYIKAMFITTPSTSYMNNWVYGVASSGTFVKNAAATWTSSCGTSTYPCNWTVETASS